MSDSSKTNKKNDYSKPKTAIDESARGLPPTENKIKMPEVKPAKKEEGK